MQSKIIAAIAFTCLPVMGFSETPPEVWGCDGTRAEWHDYYVFIDGEIAVRFEEGGLAYIRPSTNEIFDGNGWLNICDDRDGARQVVLTEFGCNIVGITESAVTAASWRVNLDNKEAHLRTADLFGFSNSSAVSKFSNCQVASPALFE